MPVVDDDDNYNEDNDDISDNTMIAIIKMKTVTLEVQGSGLPAFGVQAGIWQFSLLFNLL